MNTENWKKPMPINKQTGYIGWSINSGTTGSLPNKAKWCGSYLYWMTSIRKLGVFVGLDRRLGPGCVIAGQIDPVTRSTIKIMFNKFMADYDGVSGNKNAGISLRPFSGPEEAEIRRVLDGGILLDV